MSFDPMGYPEFGEVTDGQKDAIIAAQKIHCKGQRAEIERLKDKLNKADQIVRGFDLMIRADRKLIIELCDALDCYQLWQGHGELLQRAREATNARTL
jgi:hypothetical protein